MLFRSFDSLCNEPLMHAACELHAGNTKKMKKKLKDELTQGSAGKGISRRNRSRKQKRKQAVAVAVNLRYLEQFLLAFWHGVAWVRITLLRLGCTLNLNAPSPRGRGGAIGCCFLNCMHPRTL